MFTHVKWVLLLNCLIAVAAATENKPADDAKKVAQATGTAIRKVGTGVVTVTRTVGHATRTGAKEIIKTVKQEKQSEKSH